MFIWFWIDFLNDSKSIFCSNIRFFIPIPKLGKFTRSPGYVNKRFNKLALTWSLIVLVPENKLVSFRNYNEDQMETIESLWEEYEGYRDLVNQFCRVEVVLV